jgi:lipopolysaccharide/colanic/teichoic acid biosynthesis glycosyltransferase
MELKEVESIPLVVVGSLRLATWERLLKRAMDVVGAAALLIVAAPFLLYAAIRIRREIGTPVIFRQTRVGFHGRPFTILKIHAVPAGTPDAQQRQDRAAAIVFCKFLRSYSLDELPQLWNVLRGDMSLVGPRPETPERVRRYNPWNRRRLQVKPGITGLAQVAGVRGDHDFDTKSRFDVRYVEYQSLLLDLQILLQTPLVIWKRRTGRNFAAPAATAAEAPAQAAAVGVRAEPPTAAPMMPRVGRCRPPAPGETKVGRNEDHIQC